MDSPVLSLLLFVLGTAAGVVLMASLLPGRADSRRWVIAALAAAIVLVAANWPAAWRNALVGLDAQRGAFAQAPERAAREKCLMDTGRGELAAALGAIREQMPEDARFDLRSDGPPILPCLALNLLPRRPVLRDAFDRERDWTIYEGAAPEEVAEALEREDGLPEAERRYLAYSPRVVLVRPRGTAAP